jgi:hypothetical protein
MLHPSALALLSLWAAGNFYVWSLKQEPLLLFWESIGSGAAALAAVFWYVTRSTDGDKAA